MGLIKYKIGELIELVQEINSELKYGPDDVRGMTIQKKSFLQKLMYQEQTYLNSL